ncbi:MAG: hypothetical protein U0X91_27425 [Spirosomataceae bacterium]
MFKISNYSLLLIVTVIAGSFFLFEGPEIKFTNQSPEKQQPINYIPNNVTSLSGTTIWSDNFENGCASNCIANTYNGWSIVDNVDGTTGGTPNNWFVSCAEEGVAAPGCGTGCIGDASLHIGANPGAGGDMGASYNETGAVNATYRLAVSPTISTVGYNQLALTFEFIAYGSSACSEDRAQLWLSTDNGATWPAMYQYCLTSVCCGACNGYSQGQWTVYTLTLPAAFENNPNVRIGFHWRNNGNGSGTDPSVAIDDIKVLNTDCTPPAITSATAAATPICTNATTTLTANGVTGTNTTVTWWTGAGGTGTQIGTGTTSNPVGPGTYYARVTGDCSPPAETSVTVGLLDCTPDYTITTSGNNIVITDDKGTGETLTVSEVGGNIRFIVAGRTYKLDGGLTTDFTTPADIALADKIGITINTGTGNDIINIGAFTTPLPSLTINGGSGDDDVNLNGSITFAANANLNIDLQDDPGPGTDAVVLADNTNVVLSGTGTATLKMSKSFTINNGALLQTANGALTIEANRQSPPSTGDFTGVNVIGGTLQAIGTGIVTIKGIGGNGTDNQRGVNVENGGKITGGTTGTLTIDGIGGNSAGTNNNGVRVDGAASKIGSNGAEVNITAKGN